jgi:hypothetical protein
MLAMQVLVCKLAERVASFYPSSYDPSRTKDQVFAPTTASPVAWSFSGDRAAVAEQTRFSRVSLPFEVVQSKPLP